MKQKMAFAVTLAAILVMGLAQAPLAQCGATKSSAAQSKDSQAMGGCGSSAMEKMSDAQAMSAATMKMTILEAAQSAGSFNTLLAAVKAAGLADALGGEGPFTVFAPSDEAFANLPEGTLEALLNDKAKLASILTYHVVPGKVMASEVVGLKAAQTLNGQSLAVGMADEHVMIDGAKVVSTDIVCSNGVIHVIDSVVLPKATS